ncbi:hypothetical protein CKO31_20535 [Thiohalocapsa halophila]|uniref:Tyr recombinase domain-containing protein n=1 Tax=Thiohalocapsa halophila TaxID=69359 RepID=A0ABS1CME2_9GAMM|nr:hypothetical protein [Thiohalocapsa halophila]MBK1633094.1 hypothetical protein [Thiohalocapsa halophila]
MRLKDLHAPLLSAFLIHLEHQCGNCVKTGNNRLAARHAFFRFACYEAPQRPLLCQQVLVIPTKRYPKRSVTLFNEQQTAGLLAAPDRSTWIGRRDHTLLLVAVQTRLRNSELRALRSRDVALNGTA